MRGESYQLLSRLDLSKLVKQSAVTLGKRILPAVPLGKL